VPHAAPIVSHQILTAFATCEGALAFAAKQKGSVWQQAPTFPVA
jgi:hypothetical protein